MIVSSLFLTVLFWWSSGEFPDWTAAVSHLPCTSVWVFTNTSKTTFFEYPHLVTPVSGFIELVSISILSLVPRPGSEAYNISVASYYKENFNTVIHHLLHNYQRNKELPQTRLYLNLCRWLYPWQLLWSWIAKRTIETSSLHQVQCRHL